MPALPSWVGGDQLTLTSNPAPLSTTQSTTISTLPSSSIEEQRSLVFNPAALTTTQTPASASSWGVQRSRSRWSDRLKKPVPQQEWRRRNAQKKHRLEEEAEAAIAAKKDLSVPLASLDSNNTTSTTPIRLIQTTIIYNVFEGIVVQETNVTLLPPNSFALSLDKDYCRGRSMCINEHVKDIIRNFEIDRKISLRSLSSARVVSMERMVRCLFHAGIWSYHRTLHLLQMLDDRWKDTRDLSYKVRKHKLSIFRVVSTIDEFLELMKLWAVHCELVDAGNIIPPVVPVLLQDGKEMLPLVEIL